MTLNLVLAMTLNCTWQSYICSVIIMQVTKVQFSTIEVLVTMRMTPWEFMIVPCLAACNASAICLKMLVMRFADVQ